MSTKIALNRRFGVWLLISLASAGVLACVSVDLARIHHYHNDDSPSNHSAKIGRRNSVAPLGLDRSLDERFVASRFESPPIPGGGPSPFIVDIASVNAVGFAVSVLTICFFFILWIVALIGDGITKSLECIACVVLFLIWSGFIVALFVFDPSNSPSLASFALSILTDLLLIVDVIWASFTSPLNAPRAAP